MTANTPIETMLNNLETLRLPELQACFKQMVGKATRAPNRKFLIRKIREAAAAQQGATEQGATEEPPALTKAEPSIPPAAAPTAPKKAARKGKAKPAAKPETTVKKTRRRKTVSAPVAPPPAPEATILNGPLGPITVATHPPKKPTPKKPTPTQKIKKAPLRVAPRPAPAPAPEPATTDETESNPATTDESESTTAPPRPDLKALSVDDLRTAYVEEVGRPTKSTDRNYLIWKIGQARKGKVPVGPVSRTRSAAAGERRVLPLRMHEDTIDALDDVWRRHSLSSRMDMFRCALHQYLTSLDEHEAAALVR